MALFEELKIFTGNSHPQLAEDICQYLNIPLGHSETFKFANDNTFVRIQENIRQRDVFVIQPGIDPVNDSIMELLIMIDAAKRASAGRITAVIPYYGYGRTDKKDQPRVPITARLIADLITVAGADRLLTIDLHAAQIQGFFNIPVDELTAMPILTEYFSEKNIDDLVVVAVDVGISKRARDLAQKLGAPLAIVEKRRVSFQSAPQTLNVIGDVAGKTAVLFDDEIDSGSSTVNAANALRDRGTKAVYAVCTHGVLSAGSTERILDSDIRELVVTDTIPVFQPELDGRLTVLSVAQLFGEAIHRIHNGLSVGSMFE